MKAFIMMFLLFVAAMATGTVSAAQEQAQQQQQTQQQQVSLQDQQPQALDIQDAAQTQQIQDCFQPQIQTQQAMKVHVAGQRYELQNFEQPEQPGQVIQFIHKETAGDANGTMRTVLDGTTNEEVLKMLIDRFPKQGRKLPCRENSIALTHIETALLCLQKRTADREAQGVEGTMQPHV